VFNSCRIWSPTQLNTPHTPFPATHCLFISYFDTGKGVRGVGNWGGKPERRLEGQ
jgi:hypothetical protein